jgi:hypothetical protein
VVLPKIRNKLYGERLNAKDRSRRPEAMLCDDERMVMWWYGHIYFLSNRRVASYIALWSRSCSSYSSISCWVTRVSVFSMCRGICSCRLFMKGCSQMPSSLLSEQNWFWRALLRLAAYREPTAKHRGITIRAPTLCPRGPWLATVETTSSNSSNFST